MAKNIRSNAYEGGLTVDPSIPPGVPATVGAIFLRVDTPELWQKVGVLDTDWILIAHHGASPAPLLTLVYRPGATGAEAPGGNVYTNWADLQTALDQTKFLGYRQVEFDNRFAPPSPTGVPAIAGLNPALIPAPAVPGTIYDHRDVIWVQRLLAPGDGSMQVEIEDGAQFKNLMRVDCNILNLIYNGTTPGNVPFKMSRWDNTATGATAPTGLTFFNKHNLRIYNTVVGAQPMFLFDTPGTPCFFDLNGNSALGNGAPLPAPIIELVAGQVGVIICTGGPVQIFDNAFKGPVGSTIQLRINGAGTFEPLAIGTQALAAGQTFSFPSFSGALAVVNHVLAQRFGVSGTVAVSPGPTTAKFGEVQRVNASGGPVAITLPVSKLTAPTTGTFGYAGSAITVQEVGGGANAITVSAAAGESINGAATFVMTAAAYASNRFWCDGLGAWFVTE